MLIFRLTILSKKINNAAFEAHLARSRTSSASTPGGLVDLVRERLGERRFYALAAAVREHEERATSWGLGLTAHDEELYRNLRLICGEL